MPLDRLRGRLVPPAWAATAVLAAVSAAGCSTGRSAVQADLLLSNGMIYTVDAERSRAEAVAIADGAIVYVGNADGAVAHQGPDTQVIDLGGRLVLPAFQDCHIHPISGGIEALTVDLNGLGNVEAYAQAIAAYAEAHPDEPWITGGGWSVSVFGPGALAPKEIIDAVVPDRPVYLSSSDGHTGWANTKALEAAGITADTPDPLSGRIDRDPATGEAIGSLQEGAMNLVRAHVPPTELDRRLAGLRYAVDMLNGYGITSIQVASARRPQLEAYRELDERGELTLRAVASLWWDRERGEEQIDDMVALREEFTQGRVRATTVKIMQDGVLENFTAALLEPYLQHDGSRGFPMVDPEALKSAVANLDRRGFQVHFHAIGDAAVRQSLDAVEAARMQNGDLGHRHHISHLELIHPDDVPRFQQLQVIANFQPLWAASSPHITELTIPYLGPERSQWLYPLGGVLDAGAMLAFGSDWSVSTANPFPQIETALTRQGGGAEEPFLPEQRIDLASAVEAFTINAAFVNGIEEQTGSIEVGKLADLVVVDRNLFEIDPRNISDAQVLLTLMEGVAVHGDLANLAQ